jgi:hypothetical protein
MGGGGQDLTFLGEVNIQLSGVGVGGAPEILSQRGDTFRENRLY